MKVGIFTFPNSISYGAALQMYALYRTVGRLGHEVEIVNYHNAYMKAEKHMMSGKAKRLWKDDARRTARKLLHFKMYNAFRSFEKRNLVHYPAKAIHDGRKLIELAKRYDALICGSDQVWNPDITGGDLSYFLNFCGEETHRISYAPSFGIDSFSDEFCNAIQRELECFHALSVRELPGQELIQRLLGKRVPIVADPTFFLSPEEWITMEQSHPAADGDYILYYTVRSSKSLFKRAIELSKRTDMKLVVVGGNFAQNLRSTNKNIEYAVDIGPEQWLYLVRHSRYVVTNSFHGTAFSINFRKDFCVEYSARTNSRLVHIVETLGLTKQIVGEGPLSLVETDYSVVEQVLPQIREDSLNYLTQALN